MTGFKKAYTLAELPEAGQYRSHQELLVMTKELPEARQYSCHPEFISGSAGNDSRQMLKQVQHDNRRAAFTLAEVLITLGIIGVVAAMTIPTLMRTYQLKVTETKVKQAYSMVSQAIKFSQVDNGDMSGWDFENTDRFMKEYILPYLKTIHTCSKTGYELEPACKGTGVSRYSIEYILPNGSMISFCPGIVSGKDIRFIINVYNKNVHYNNAGSVGGLEGKDWFYFSAENGAVLPAVGWSQNLNRTTAVENCKTLKQRCTALFFLDGFKFLPDNPRAK